MHPTVLLCFACALRRIVVVTVCSQLATAIELRQLVTTRLRDENERTQSEVIKEPTDYEQ